VQKVFPGPYRDRRFIVRESCRIRLMSRRAWLNLEGPTGMELAAVRQFVGDFEFRLALLGDLISAVEHLEHEIETTEATRGAHNALSSVILVVQDHFASLQAALLAGAKGKDVRSARPTFNLMMSA